jgi:3-oxoacyl-[acyl-carrier protein] reductase
VRELWSNFPDPTAAERRDIEAVPARRLGLPDEIGAAVAFLCSAQAAYISGVVLPVDGGLLRGVW